MPRALAASVLRRHRVRVRPAFARRLSHGCRIRRSRSKSARHCDGIAANLYFVAHCRDPAGASEPNAPATPACAGRPVACRIDLARVRGLLLPVRDALSRLPPRLGVDGGPTARPSGRSASRPCEIAAALGLAGDRLVGRAHRSAARGDRTGRDRAGPARVGIHRAIERRCQAAAFTARPGVGTRLAPSAGAVARVDGGSRATCRQRPAAGGSGSGFDRARRRRLRSRASRPTRITSLTA